MPEQSQTIQPKAVWQWPDAAPDSFRADMSGFDDTLVQILWARGVDDSDKAGRFLEYYPGSDDASLIAGLPAAVDRIKRAIESGESVVVYGDFDADGVTATAVLVQTMRALGADVRAHIPHRARDGYGVRSSTLAKMADDGVGLVVTVDCGIRAVEEIAVAGRVGLDVIVTDHHVLPDQLPDASAVINPRRTDCGYEFKDLAGVGLAYKLATALLDTVGGTVSTDVGPLGATDLLDLVALGTVADVVPLLGENRSLVKRGLEVVRHGKRPGIRAMARLAKLDLADTTARSIAFVLAPRLNAAGRMDDADVALELLLATDEGEARRLADILENRNNERREITELALQAAEKHLEGQTDAPFLWYAAPDLSLGITGLVASRLAERYHRPAAVARVDGDTARGSMRTIAQFNVVAALEQVSDILVRYGGHAKAAGFTVQTENLSALQARLGGIAAEQLEGRDLRPTLSVDAVVEPGQLGRPLYEALEALAPFGEGNRRPLLLARGVTTSNVRVVGANHLKFAAESVHEGASMDAIAFGQADRHDGLTESDRVDIVLRIVENLWRGRRQIEMHVQDLSTSS